MTYDTRQLPAFPTDIPIADLPILRLADLLATSSGASNDELFRACRASGFFYLDLTGCELGESLLRNASNLRTIAREFMAEASREKEAYGGTTIEKPWGYRYIEDEDAIEDGEKVRKWEGLGLRSTDFTGQSSALRYPPLVTSYGDSFRFFVDSSRKTLDLLLDLIGRSLGLPSSTFHALHDGSADVVRFNRAPGNLPFDEAKARNTEHTDFGTLTLVFNWLGGLQVRSPAGDWEYIAPKPGQCCVVNVGDSLVRFTAGLFTSSVHRIVPPPGKQFGNKRDSVVYALRPRDDAVMSRLKGGLVDAQPRTADEEDGFDGLTNVEYTKRRETGGFQGVMSKNGFEKRSYVLV